LRLSGRVRRKETAGTVQTTLTPQKEPRAEVEDTHVELAVQTWLDPVLDEPEVKIPNLRAEEVRAIEARPWAGAGHRQKLRELGALLRGELLTLKVGRRPARARRCECGHLFFSAVRGTRCAFPLRHLPLRTLDRPGRNPLGHTMGVPHRCEKVS